MLLARPALQPVGTLVRTVPIPRHRLLSSTRHNPYRPFTPSSHRSMSSSAAPKPSLGPLHTSSSAHPSYRVSEGKRSQSQKSTTNGKKQFSYKIAAAFSGKKYKFNASRHFFSYDSTTAQRWISGELVTPTSTPKGRIPSGQDSCFIGQVGKSDSVAFGVTDGVGGYIDQGIDSADFAHGLCYYMEEVAREYTGSALSLGAQKLLDSGYSRTCANEDIIGGGSTACVAVASSDGRINIANLGDSGFMQLRLKKVEHFSDPQTHAFNTPYQLSQIPPKLLAQIEQFGGGEPFSDMPSIADVSTHDLQHGDVLIFATDGVWDNLSSSDLLGIVGTRLHDLGVWVDGAGGPAVGKDFEKYTDTEVNGTGKALHSLLATDIVQNAKEAGMTQRRDGPFAKAWNKVYPDHPYHGGKPDDIAVVVALVLEHDGGVDGVKSKL